MSTVVVIPSRLRATRLPNKPLAMIAGKPMIQWVYENASKADVGDVIVATCCDEILDVVKRAGGRAVLTDPDLPSGTDRVFAAVKSLSHKYDKIVNVQGDLPFIDPMSIKKVVDVFQKDSDITSLCAPIMDDFEIGSPSVVKPVLSFINDSLAKALYFSRSPVPYGAKTYYHHLGVYGYTFDALEKFVSLAPSYLEKSESLEQLRALEAGMTIHMGFVDSAPIAIDTPEDLEKARAYVKTL
ncbi:MAG: 3-deoxy-manno-octulosonate cytidylyltransferase [Alphaproteobacteria bacterium CG_4_10_14_0_8_um_filter_37_21]|nr:MAG: 3-deoxy-manno-octulosonate cytidylyltransferase [Alphaproteobacteria bacterium CG_4_10_14_0_8_um_filter_37_21]